MAVVYIDGQLYEDSSPAQPQYNQSGHLGLSGLYTGFNRTPQLTTAQKLQRGLLTPINPTPAAPKAQPRQLQAMTQMPEAGWSAPTGGAGTQATFDSILNGASAPNAAGQQTPIPQFGQPAPVAGGMPGAPAPAPAPMPNPQAPQQNFNDLGKNLMQQILAQQGGANV